jgi:chromosome segregation and condensation protein ScpB
MIIAEKSIYKKGENLPVKSLEAILSEPDIEQEITQLLSILEKKDTLLEKKDTLIEKLQNELLILRRKLFGHSSERYIKEDPNQWKLLSVEKLCR